MDNIKDTRKRSRAYGYGNRVVTSCETCGSVLSDNDPGNAGGIRWAAMFRRSAIEAHTVEACARIIKDRQDAEQRRKLREQRRKLEQQREATQPIQQRLF